MAGVARNKAILVIPWWRGLWWLYRLSPALAMALARRQHRAYQRLAERSGPPAP